MQKQRINSFYYIFIYFYLKLERKWTKSLPKKKGSERRKEKRKKQEELGKVVLCDNIFKTSHNFSYNTKFFRVFVTTTHPQLWLHPLYLSVSFCNLFFCSVTRPRLQFKTFYEGHWYICYTCMLLYLLKVLQQTGQENWVGPMRIWEGVGIQYCPLLSLKPAEEESASPCSLSVISEEEERTEAISAALGHGNPMWSATVTVLSWSSSPSPSSCSSSLGWWWWWWMWILSSTSMVASCSCFVGLSLKRGSSSLRGGEGGKEEKVVVWWW